MGAADLTRRGIWKTIRYSVQNCTGADAVHICRYGYSVQNCIGAGAIYLWLQRYDPSMVCAKLTVQSSAYHYIGAVLVAPSPDASRTR